MYLKSCPFYTIQRLINWHFQGIFAQGIGQSGSSTALWAFDTEPEYNSRAVAARLDCDFPENHTLIVECLREKTPKEVMDAYDEHKVPLTCKVLCYHT